MKLKYHLKYVHFENLDYISKVSLFSITIYLVESENTSYIFYIYFIFLLHCPGLHLLKMAAHCLRVSSC